MMKKHILQLSNYYYPEIGGIEKIAQAISDAVKDEYDVRVLCFTHKKKSRNSFVDGVEVIRCGTKAKIASQQLSFDMVRAIKKQIRSFKPDIVIIHVPNPFLEAILLRYLPDDCKLIVYWHSDIVKQKVGRTLFGGLNKSLLKRADKIVATSPNYIEGSRELSLFRDKCVAIPNCIDEDQLIVNDNVRQIASEIRTANHDKHLCVCVGRQVPYKGFEYAIQAVKNLGDDYALYIVGREGESTPLLKELAEDSPQIHFVGEASNDKLHAYMYACDIFCFPSVTKNEAFGIALAEGMYYGKPAVTFTIPGSGVNYVSLNDITGIEVPNRDTNAYAEAVRKLAEDPQLREQYGKAAAARVNELFLKSQFAENIMSILNF